MDLGLGNDIYTNHSDYNGEVKDANIGNENVLGTDSRDYTMIVERRSDGSMLAYKGIQII